MIYEEKRFFEDVCILQILNKPGASMPPVSRIKRIYYNSSEASEVAEVTYCMYDGW